MSASKMSSAQATALGDPSVSKKGLLIEGKEKDGDGQDERSPSPEVAKCAICLGDVVNRSRSNSCIHSFCFGCLLEWSKVKPECPLCKSSFTTIYHNFRSNTDYDEYVVPTPIPSFSIRFTASAAGNYRLSPFIRVLGARTHQHSPLGHAYDGVSIPAGMFAPPPPPFVPPANPFNNGASARPEFFGDVVNDHRRTQEEAVQMPGYQNRRRRYDRNEWVQPFGSSLQPGSVVFPSVEYVRTHPAAISRLRTWLFRELNVLLGLLRSREQMAFVYDLILHLINHYDVRSRDFRDMINSYFGPRTAHFQHELYHFILSGMGMEEYDRVAEYPSTSMGTRSRRNAVPEVITLDSDDEDNSNSLFTCNNNSNRSGGNTDDDDIIVLSPSSDEDEGSSNARSATSPVVLSSFSLTNPSRSYANVVASSPSPSMTTATRSNMPTIEMPQPEPERPRRHTTNRSRVHNSNVDPEMPVLEPEVSPFNPVLDDVLMFIDGHLADEINPNSDFTRDNRTSSTIDRSRATAATATVTNSSSSNFENSSRPSVLSSGSASRSTGVELPPFIETAEIDLDLDVSVEPYSSPTRQDSRPLSSPDFPILRLRRGTGSTRERDLNWQRSQEREGSSRGSRAYQSFIDTYITRRDENGSGSAFVPYEPVASSSARWPLSRPPRTSCIHETASLRPIRNGNSTSTSATGSHRPTSPPFRVNLYPHGISSSQVMDLSRSAGLISNSSNRNSSSSASNATTSNGQPQTLCETNAQPPRRAATPIPSTSRISPSMESLAAALNSFTASLNAAAGGPSKKPEIKQAPESNLNHSDSEDDDELECLGSFPIQKKPPLAVITLSSDDEDDESRVKAEQHDQDSVSDLVTYVCSDEADGRNIDPFIADWNPRTPSSIEEIDFGVPTLGKEFDQRKNMFSTIASQSGNSSTSGENIPGTSSSATRSSDTGLKISLRRDPYSGELSTSAGGDSASSSSTLKKRRNSSPYPSPRKSKRLRVSSSSEEDSGNEKTQSTSQISLASSSNSSTPANIPKKRKYVESDGAPSDRNISLSLLSSTDSSSDSSGESDEDFEITKKSKRGRTSKRHSPKKKSKKSKSKKSKKPKKSKSKAKESKETKSKSRSSSSKTDKTSSSSGSRAHSHKSGGSSKSSPDTSRSKKGNQNTLPHSYASATVTSNASSSASSYIMNLPQLPLCSDLDIDDSSSQTNGILDLSYHPRTETHESSTFSEIDDVFDLRMQHPSLTNVSTTPLSSTVDVSSIFGSPSRTLSYWDELTASATSARRNSWID